MFEVQRCAPGHREAVVATLADAFFDDPVHAYLFTDPDVRRAALPAWFDALLDAVPDGGHVDADPEVTTVGVWHPPGARPDDLPEGELPAMVRVAFEHLGDVAAERLAALGVVTEYHPSEPHWYLALLGTRTDRQGQGRGAVVLASMLDACDRAGLPAYLESSNPLNVGLYERHGFVVTDTVHIGGDGPLMTFMWREPSPI